MNSSLIKIVSTALLLAVMMTGCTHNNVAGGGGNTSSGGKTVVEKNPVALDVARKHAETAVEALPDRNFEGEKFVIASTLPELYVTDNDEGVISAAITKRNTLVETKYNVKITTKKTSYDDIKSAVLSGAAYADIVSAPATEIYKLAYSGLLMNMYSLPYIQYDAEYMNPQLVNALTVNNRLYALSNEFTHVYKSGWAIYCDTGIMEELGVDIYSLVKSGEWTWDKFLTLSETAAAAIMDKSYLDPNADVFGYTTSCTKTYLERVIWASSGISMLGNSAETVPQVPVASEEYDTITEKIKQLINTKAYYEFESGGAEKIAEKAHKMFANGNALFYITRTENISKLSDKKTSWMILPLPKISTEQARYYTFADEDSMAIAALKTNKDTEFTGIVLNALMAASHEQINEAAKATYINYYMTDNKSAVMLTKIFETTYTDASFQLAVNEDIAAVTSEALQSAVESGYRLFELNEKPVLKNAFNSAMQEYFN